MKEITLNFSETAIVDGTLCALACCSVLTWSLIVLKAGEILWYRYRNQPLLKNLDAKALLSVNQDDTGLSQDNLTTSVGRLWSVGSTTYQRAVSKPALNLEYTAAWHELIERSLRQQLQKEKARLDTGLGWLASIGTTAPFIGLFGTVWGIMHALKDISAQGNASLEVVAGPIGEALIATAVGLAVAIPAVIAYNFFLRQNRQLLAGLEHFSTDFLRACIESDLSHRALEGHHVHATA